ncbi:type I restriction endonuclease [Leptolyngbya sp. 7M]|uniref:type I restriction endonuclease n=1 Tax=Leptolyngbya sp. 7M TaxID=2812896 RepID=UPI001B8D6A4C|nr:type I restriction endonuclease [Leptolyngbya sp. 7M]QYO63676.1 type I restriction enzyme HsdR N-terminal domain-containing protein [Leptolyngbya sp. 7M]
MAKIVAVTDAIQSLAEAEIRLGLRRTEDEDFFREWQNDLPPLSTTEQEALKVVWRRLLYHRADSELLEGAVMLLVVAPLLELAGFYDPPFKLKAEAAIEIAVNDGEEILRGRIDALVLQNQLWVLVLEAKKTMISVRSALPQALAYMMSNQQHQPTFGMLTNGDDILFVKLCRTPTPQYDLSRSFAIYTVVNELHAAFRVLKQFGHLISQAFD